MSTSSKDEWDGVDRRSGKDRRQTERRELQSASGVLTTRMAQRRQALRRREDLEKSEQEDHRE